MCYCRSADVCLCLCQSQVFSFTTQASSCHDTHAHPTFMHRFTHSQPFSCILTFALLSICLSVCPYVCCLSVCLHVFLPICLSICQSCCVFVCQTDCFRPTNLLEVECYEERRAWRQVRKKVASHVNYLLKIILQEKRKYIWSKENTRKLGFFILPWTSLFSEQTVQTDNYSSK